MKNPNGYGTIVKLKGNRRKPYAVRKTEGLTKGGYPHQHYLGYFATLKEAKQFLYEINEGIVTTDKTTLKEVYNAYRVQAEKQKSEKTLRVENSYRKLLTPLENKIFGNIRPVEIQDIINKQTPAVAHSLASLWRSLEKQAVFMEIPCKRFGSSLQVPKRNDPKEKQVFTEDEIKTLWEHTDRQAVSDALILIYTGMRITEYLTLTPEQVTDDIITCGIKTENGKNRKIPIHPSIYTLLQEKLKIGALQSVRGYNTAFAQWNREPLVSNHTFHECRHTFRTRLDNANANRKCIDLLLGHKGEYVGERVYTHKTLDDLRKTIQLLG